VRRLRLTIAVTYSSTKNAASAFPGGSITKMKGCCDRVRSICKNFSGTEFDFVDGVRSLDRFPRRGVSLGNDGAQPKEYRSVCSRSPPSTILQHMRRPEEDRPVA